MSNTAPTISLVGGGELTVLLSKTDRPISRQRVYQLTREPGFPAPIAELSSGRRVWNREDIERWQAERMAAS